MVDNKFPVFVQEGVITQAGLHLIEFIEAQYLPYDLPGEQANVQALNSLSGPFSEYYTIVAKLALKTPKAWLESYSQSAKNAYEVMKYVEEKANAEAEAASKLNETVDKTSKLETALAQLQETLGVKVAQLEADNLRLMAENEALKTPAKPAAKVDKKTAAKTAKAEADVTESAEGDTEESPETEA